jgi:sulfoquinovosidase
VSARFEARDGGFDLLLGDRLILRHHVDAPAFRIAKGDPTVKMVRGNFRMLDAPRDELMPAHVVNFGNSSLGLACDAQGDADIWMTLAREDDGHPAIFTAVAMDKSFDRISVNFILERDECIWGGGEQMSYLALNGRRFPMWTSEPGVGREPGTALADKMNADGSFAGGDYWTTNYPEPTILSSRRYSIRSLAFQYSEVDLSHPSLLRFANWSGAFVGELREGGSTAALVSQLANADQDRPTIPDWAIEGAIVGLKDGANSFARLEKIIAAGAAVSGLWCEDWVGIRQTSFGRRLFWDWQWNPTRYPDLPAKIAELKARGIRFLGYVNPYLAVDGPQYAEAAQLGYLAKRLDSEEPYAVDFGEFDAGVVDFTNEAAATWFSEEVIGKRMLDFGLDGWMADFGEYLPVDLRLHDGDPMEEHNNWPVRWAKVNADALASRGRMGDALFFMRAGFTGVQQYCPLLWAGDQCVDFSRHDGIGTTVTAALSSGLVGNLVSHHDVGGYTSLHGNVRTEELLYRWIDLGAFTPVMRSHEGNRPDDNLQIDSTPELLAHFARMSQLHARLAPYVRAALGENLPVQRPLFLHHDEPQLYDVQDQYLYGQDLLIAPVIEAGVSGREVIVPSEGWANLWTGAPVPAGTHWFDAPHGKPPVLYRLDSSSASLFAQIREEFG